MPRIEFFFDYGSPTQYLAWTQLPGIAERTGAEVVPRPMLLGAVFKATGNASPVMVPAKGQWMLADLARWAQRYGVPFRMNPHFPVNTLQLMRGAVAAQRDGIFPAYDRAMQTAMWVAGANLNELAVCAETLRHAGLDADALLRRIGEEAIKQELKANSDEAVARGVFGAPTCFVGTEMHFGQDRLEFVEAAARRGG